MLRNEDNKVILIYFPPRRAPNAVPTILPSRRSANSVAEKRYGGASGCCKKREKVLAGTALGERVRRGRVG